MPSTVKSVSRYLLTRTMRNTALALAFVVLSIYNVNGQGFIVDLLNVPCLVATFNTPATCNFAMTCESFLVSTTIVAQSTADYHCPNGASIENMVNVIGGIGGPYVSSTSAAYDLVTGNTIAITSNRGTLDCNGIKTPWVVEYHYENCTGPYNGGGGGDGGGGGSGGGDPGMTYCYQYCTQTGSRECLQENPYREDGCDQWGPTEWYEPHCGYVECYGG